MLHLPALCDIDNGGIEDILGADFAIPVVVQPEGVQVGVERCGHVDLALAQARLPIRASLIGEEATLPFL